MGAAKIGQEIYGILLLIFVIVVLVVVILIATVQFGNVLSGINGATTNIGNTGQTPTTLFNSLVGNYTTLVAFVGLIILLLLIGLLFVALGGLNWAKGMFGGGGRGHSEV